MPRTEVQHMLREDTSVLVALSAGDVGQQAEPHAKVLCACAMPMWS